MTTDSSHHGTPVAEAIQPRRRRSEHHASLKHLLLENQAYHTISTTRDRAPIFANPSLATVVMDTINRTRLERAHLLAWAVMPDHLHLVLVPREPYTLPQVMQNIKGNASWSINRLTQRRGPIWQQGYYDRTIRSEKHLFEAIAYVNNNPVMAHLSKEPGEYPFASFDAGDTDLERWYTAAEAG